MMELCDDRKRGDVEEKKQEHKKQTRWKRGRQKDKKRSHNKNLPSTRQKKQHGDPHTHADSKNEKQSDPAEPTHADSNSTIQKLLEAQGIRHNIQKYGDVRREMTVKIKYHLFSR